MTATPEERASAVADAINSHGVGMSDHLWSVTEALIAQAIREAEDAAIERAEAVAFVERCAREQDADEADTPIRRQASSAQAFTAKLIEAHIRSLKSKD